MNENKHLDLLASIVLIAVSLFILISGYGIHTDSKEHISVSPGLLPLILGFALLLCSIIQAFRCMKDIGLYKGISQIIDWARARAKEENTKRMLIGTIILGIYTFILLSFLPFWLASIIFMIILMLYLKAASLLKIVIISGTSVGAIVILFQILFRVPLP
ncbi:MAG: tripartite tricarboxylate transporter TctB family protein [Fusobacteriaceae bacterium]|jgi:hypothetical protein|nr:tripartite tricarboxylate transporter TctB family protein [Fusobacteriaceae bacterium]